jgi:hypothetical protein
MTTDTREEAQTDQERARIARYKAPAVALPCWTFNRRFSAESAINLLDRSQKVVGIPKWMTASGS